MKTLLGGFTACLLSINAISADYNVLLYGDTPNPDGIPAGWPAQVQPVPSNSPERGAPWQRMTDAQLAQQFQTHQAAYDAWASLRESKIRNLPRINEELERRLKGEAWEGILRANMLDFELLGLTIKLALQNAELSQLLTKAVGQSSLTNNLTVAERARVVDLRQNLIVTSTPNLTSNDRTRAVYLRDELQKVYQLWMKARELRAKVTTNPTPVNLDAETWPDSNLGE